MFGALYQLFLRTQVNWLRILGIGALGVLTIIIGLVIRGADDQDLVEAATTHVAEVGLSSLLPVACLLIAASTLGDPKEDRTLVYIWHRPVPRATTAAAAFTAAVSFTMPLMVVCLVLTAIATGVDELIGATLLATVLGVIAYCGLFTALGLRVNRALLWGLGYIVVWEGFLARVGGGVARLSVRSYLLSLVERATDVDLPQADRSVAAAVIVPILVAAISVALTARWLQTREVD